MVCIPCIIAPVLLFIWYRFIQPIVLKLWNPQEPKKAVKSSQTKDEDKTCPFASKFENTTQEPKVSAEDLSTKKSE